MDKVITPKHEFESMKRELELLRSSRLCQRLIEFEQNISKGKKFTRKDLGYSGSRACHSPQAKRKTSRQR